jgi:hypothetical protein
MPEYFLHFKCKGTFERNEKFLYLLRFKRKVNAQMVKLVDTLVSGTSERKLVQVRVLFWALLRTLKPLKILIFSGFF